MLGKLSRVRFTDADLETLSLLARARNMRLGMFAFEGRGNVMAEPDSACTYM